MVLLVLLPTSIHALAGLPTSGPVDVWIWSPSIDDPDTSVADAQAQSDAMGLRSHRYEALGMMSFVGTPIDAQYLEQRVGGDVERNQRYDLHLDRSVSVIEADVVADAIGPARDGPSVLVIDTGVDSSHPDFQDGNLAANFAAQRVGGLVVGSQSQQVVVDEAGHGTHVAGIVAGSGEAFGNDDPNHDRYEGVYHNGRIVGYQALAENSNDEDAQVDTAAALEAMDWALRDGDTYDVRVVQASWGTGGDLDPRSSVTKATLELYLAGFNVVFSAGNRGTEEEALNSFCQAPWVLCVANVKDDGTLAESSSVGTSSGSFRPYAHPDLAAPGTFITAARSTASDEGSSGGGLPGFTQPPSQEAYETRTGTSMAAPHVSATAALLLVANPDLSPDQVMDILVETATPSIHSINEVGAGMVNAREAYNLAVQTPGNRQAFEAGEQVKYGGPTTGDDAYLDDPLSIGYTSDPTGSAVTLPPKNIEDQALDLVQTVSSFATEEILIYGGIGLAALLILIWLVRIPRRRRIRRAREGRQVLRATKRTKAARRTNVSFKESS